MHKRKTFIIIAVLAALILTGGSSYYLGVKSQQSRPETVVADVVEPQASSAVDFQPIDPNYVFDLVNAERVKGKLKPLARDARLDASAQAKCDDMVARNYWSHNDPDGIEPWYWIIEQGVAYTTAGENLVKNTQGAENAVAGWMNSDSHRANIMLPHFNSTGVATCDFDTVVQHFISR